MYGDSAAFGLGHAQIEARGLAKEQARKQKSTVAAKQVIVVSEEQRLVQALLAVRGVQRNPTTTMEVLAEFRFDVALLRTAVAEEKEASRLAKAAEAEAQQQAIAEALAAERLARRTRLGLSEEEYDLHLHHLQVRAKRDAALRAHAEEVRVRNVARARASRMAYRASLRAKLQRLAPAFRRFLFVVLPKEIARLNENTRVLIAKQEAKRIAGSEAAATAAFAQFGSNIAWGDAQASDHVLHLEECIYRNGQVIERRLKQLEHLQPKRRFLKFDKSLVEAELPKPVVQALPAYLAPVVVDRSREQFTGIIVRNLRKVEGYGELRTVCDQLKRTFEAFGSLTVKNGVYVPMDKFTQMSKGYAFINFTTWRAASSAFDTLNWQTADNSRRMLKDPKTGVLREMLVELAVGQAKDSETMARVTKERAAAKAAEKAAADRAEEAQRRARAKAAAAPKPCEGVVFESVPVQRVERALDTEEFPSLAAAAPAMVTLPKFSFASVAAIVPTEVKVALPAGKVLYEGELYDDVAYLREQFAMRLAQQPKTHVRQVVVGGWLEEYEEEDEY